MFRYELRLVSCDRFGAISYTQRPDKTVPLEAGWKAVGVMEKHGTSYVILQRRRWFWSVATDLLMRPKVLAVGITTGG